MEKNIPFILLMVAVVIGGFVVFHPSDTLPPSVAAPSASASRTGSSATLATNTQTKDGITVTVESVTERADATVVLLTLDNHQYDLGQDTIYDQATLGGVESASHTQITGASGGHHVEVEVVFAKGSKGSLKLSPVAGTEFIFDGL